MQVCLGAGAEAEAVGPAGGDGEGDEGGGVVRVGARGGSKLCGVLAVAAVAGTSPVRALLLLGMCGTDGSLWLRLWYLQDSPAHLRPPTFLYYRSSPGKLPLEVWAQSTRRLSLEKSIDGKQGEEKTNRGG